MGGEFGEVRHGAENVCIVRRGVDLEHDAQRRAGGGPLPRRTGTSRLRTAGMVAGGIGIAGLLAGGTFDYLGYQAHQREKNAAAAGDVAGYDQARADVASRASTAKILYAGGALSAGTGLVLYLVGGARSAAPVALDFRPLPGGGLALVSGRLP
ncbi:MAG TPA: hypothetical protein VF912_19940 [Anaeromyxobacter sp.]